MRPVAALSCGPSPRGLASPRTIDLPPIAHPANRRVHQDERGDRNRSDCRQPAIPIGNLPFLDRKNALARLLRNTEAGILFNEHIAEDSPIVFAYACRLGAEGIVSKKVDGAYQSGPCRVWIKVRNPASTAVQRERSELWNR
jgi:hypothetical protein